MTMLERAHAEVEQLRQQLKQSVFADSEECKMLTIENKRLREALLEIAQGTNEKWTHDWALRALEQSESKT